MDIHKPKPWHGVREFLKEYAIVVVGVLTALAGEQFVESLNRAHEARATEAALREEVGVSLVNAAERLMEQDCLRARLAGLSQALTQDGAWRANPWSPVNGVAHRSIGHLPQVYRTPIRPWNNASWQAVLASGGAAHLSEDQLRVYGSYYRGIEQLREIQAREEALITAIQPLAYDQAFSADKRVELQADLAALDRGNDEMTLIASQFIERARRNGFPPDAAEVDTRFRFLSSVFGSCAQRLGSTADALGAAQGRPVN